jgi:hypothetical protein
MSTHVRRAAGVLVATHIVPVELQEFDSASQPTTALLNSFGHEVQRDGLGDGAKDAPLRGREYLSTNLRWQLVSKLAVDELCITLESH